MDVLEKARYATLGEDDVAKEVMVLHERVRHERDEKQQLATEVCIQVY